MSALSAALLIFSFELRSAFLPCRSARQHSSVLVYAISDIERSRAENLGRYFSCMRRTDWGDDFEFILMVKTETRHPVEGYFGSEFRAICNHCGVMAA